MRNGIPLKIIGNQTLFVPVEEEEVVSLYQVEASESSDSWRVNGIIDRKLRNFKTEFERHHPQNLLAQLTVHHHEKGLLPNLTASTQSVYLGLFLGMTRFILHRELKSAWDSFTITGDLSPHDDGIALAPVGHIEQKYAGVQAYAETHPCQSDRKHLFLYVSDDTPVIPGMYSNVEVKAFSPQDPLGEVLAFVFERRFDERQQQLFNWARESLNRQGTYVETEAFNRMKQEACSPDWKGYLIHGEGETGKSALALELAYWLAEREYIYAPIWVKIDNKILITAIAEHRSKSQEKHGKKTNPVADYIARQIAERLQTDWSPEQGFKPLMEAIQKKHYLLVIDDIECNRVSQVVNAVRDCIFQCSKKPPVIITSKLAEGDPGCAKRELGLRVITASETGFTVDEVDTLVKNIAKGEKYEEKLATDEYNAFIEQLHTHFKFFPGLIWQFVPMLTDSTLHELRPILLNMGNKDIRKKVEDIYYAIFSRMKKKTFIKAVLFAFIGTTDPDADAPLTEQHGIGKTAVANQIRYSSVALFDIGLQDEVILEKEIVLALRELDHRHLIYQINLTASETSYAMKSLAYVAFMFDPKLCGDVLPSTRKTLKDSLIDTEDMVFKGLEYDQDVILLKPILDRLQEEEGDISAYPFLYTVANYSSIPEYIDLLLGYGMDINRHWKQLYNQTPLHLAAGYNQNIDILKIFLDKGAEINAKDEDDETPLHKAAYSNFNVAISSMLIERGAEINAKDAVGRTPLHHVAHNGSNPAVISILLDYVADMYDIAYDDLTPLFEAAKNKNITLLKTFLDRGADVLVPGTDGVNPFHAAVMWNENEKVIEMIIDSGADIHIEDTDGYTLLHWAATNSNLAIFQMFLKKGLDIYVKGLDGSTLLHGAAMNSKPAIITLLLDNGFNINAADNNGLTPLHNAAAYNENPNIITLLIAKGADIHAKTIDGQTMLHFAAVNPDFNNFMTFVMEGLDIHVKDSNGLTPLHIAAAMNREPAIIGMLIDIGLDVHATSSDGMTPLHFASNDHSDPDIIEELLNKGADINAKTVEDLTPLHCATMNNYHIKIIETLIKNGADVNAKDKKGMTSLHFAAKHSALPEIIIALIKAGADVNAKDADKGTPLHYAAYNSATTDIINILIANNANVNSKINDGETPLHLASYNSNPQIAITLIKAGAKLKVRNSGKQTALHYLQQRENWPGIEAVIHSNI
jgi:ankyrin repeat protein